MARSYQSPILALAVLALLACVTPAGASSLDLAYLTGQVQTSSGIVNPAVLVGFNPQPEPPGSVLNLSNPNAPAVSWSNETGNYAFLFGFDFGGPVSFLSPLGGPDPTPLHVGLNQVLVDAQMAPGGAHSFFDVFFDVSTNGFDITGSSVAFNPQPEPPGFEGKNLLFSFDPPFTSVDITLRILDHETGNEMTFAAAQVPEPGTLALVAIGGLLGLGRRWARSIQ